MATHVYHTYLYMQHVPVTNFRFSSHVSHIIYSLLQIIHTLHLLHVFQIYLRTATNQFKPTLFCAHNNKNKKKSTGEYIMYK